jgi:prophage antirepressor-like protein
VCRVLGIGNARDAVSSLDDDEKFTVANTDGKFGPYGHTFNLINESGLYALVFRSRKPEAKQFRKWVTSEVLPSIRKYGYYADPVAKESNMIFGIGQSGLAPTRLQAPSSSDTRI